jgi:Protein of unknown function (DUF1194)
LKVTALSWFRCFFAVSLFLALLVTGPSKNGTTSSALGGQDIVDLALVLAVDSSYSVDTTEYRLQMQGLAAAFRDNEVIEAMKNGPSGRIAVSVVQWSDLKSQVVVIPWRIISGQKTAADLSLTLSQTPRQTASGGTSITTMIKKGAAMLSRLPFYAQRKVIDISADGRNNNGGDPRPIRDLVAANGITINGLAIINEVITLDKYFEIYITGGPGNFVIVANDYSAYATAIKRKLILEILGPGLV